MRRSPALFTFGEGLLTFRPLRAAPALSLAPGASTCLRAVGGAELNVAAAFVRASGTERSATSAMEARLKGLGTWSGVAGEAVMYAMRKPEAIVTMMLLCDGDPQRKNRAFALNPDVKMGTLSPTEPRALVACIAL